MEFPVKLVAGKENCFVSLPLLLIQTLQSTSSGALPSLLALELRSTSDNSHWVVAWAGESSSSSAIEVAQQFGECISLADNSSVNVRVVSNVPHATLVTIEPDTEDDWEVMELNSEHAEASILKQVRILNEAMRFPLWLHGHIVLTFRVVSIYPKKVVVQLMPGTEVAVAPKRRKKNVDPNKDSSLVSLNECNSIKAMLRIQESDRRFISNADANRVNLDVMLTSVAFIHPETAKSLSLEILQSVVVVPKFSKESSKASGTNISKTKSDLIAKVIDNQNLTDKKEYRQAVVHILISDSVAKGHLMVAQSLRLYMRAGLHSWVFLKTCHAIEKKIPSVSLSPCQFKLMRQENAHDKNGREIINNHKSLKKKMHKKTTSELYVNSGDWSFHDEVLSILSDKSDHKSNEHAALQSDSGRGLQNLILSWFSAQLEALSSISGTEVNSLILNHETLLHFEANCLTVGTRAKVQATSNGSLENRDPMLPLLYVLKLKEEPSYDRKVSTFKVTFGERKKNMNEFRDFRLFEKIKFSDPVSFTCSEERISESNDSLDISSIGWIGPIASDVFNRLSLLLSSSSGFWFSSHNFPLPGHILIYGPSGSGKTSLAKAAAKSLENHGEILAHIIFISCSKFNPEKVPVIREAISSYMHEALNRAPSVVIFDDLDSIISSSESEGSQSITAGAALTDFVVDIIDEYGEKRLRSCGIGPIAFVATGQSLQKIPQPMSSSGRFDFHVQLPAPAALERKAMLRHEIQRRSLHCSDDILHNVASKCDGYDSYDLEILVDRAVHSAVGRFLPCVGPDEREPTLLGEDFSKAMHDFLPVAMRDITKPTSDGSRSGWNDVGGLVDIQNAIKEMIELPSKFPKIFAQAPLRLRSNVLLYGPPGCGKTHIVGAAAAACSLRFISVKGPELLNKYIGASEQAVRDIFSKATAAAPCLLFFDEFDSIAPKRGHDNTGVTDRVVNQFLTELDGVEVLNGVFVFAATSRPDLLDAALLRPGRLDRLLFCDFPSPSERLDILTKLSKKLPIAQYVNLEAIVNMTEGFSGADLQALLSDAQLAAVHEVLDSADDSVPKRSPLITDTLLKSIASKARPSVSDVEKRRLYNIYSQFLDAKRSVAAQSRDVKGKRATLA